MFALIFHLNNLFHLWNLNCSCLLQENFWKPRYVKKMQKIIFRLSLCLAPLSPYFRSYFNQHVDWTFVKHQAIIICAYFWASKDYSISKPWLQLTMHVLWNIYKLSRSLTSRGAMEHQFYSIKIKTWVFLNSKNSFH